MKLETIFDNENSFMKGINKFNQLVGLNLLVLVCCIPVITAGAAFTAMHDYLFKLYDDTEGSILKSFSDSFKKNFYQATIAWMIFLGIFIIIAADILVLVKTEFGFPLILKIIFVQTSLMIFGVFCYCFPTIAVFKGSLRILLKDSFLMSLGMLKKTILLFIIYLSPWCILAFFPIAGWLTLLLGFTGPAYTATCLYAKEFEKMKKKIQDAEDLRKRNV